MKNRIFLFLFIFSVCTNLFAEIRANIPHIATKDGWETWLIVENSGFTDDLLNVSLFNNGNEISNTNYNVLKGESKYIQLSNGQCGKIIYNGINTVVKISYVHLTDKGIAEFILDDKSSKEINFLMPSYLSSNLTWMGIALINTDESTASVTLEAFDNLGIKLSEKVISIPINSKSVGLVENYFPNISFKDIAIIKATSGNLITGINISGEENSKLLFTKTVVTPLKVNDLVIPHIATQFEYWNNLLVFDNTNNTNETVNLNLFSNGQLIVDEEIEIQSKENIVINLNLYKDLKVDSGLIKNCNPGLNIRLSYEFKETGAISEFLLNNLCSNELVYNFPGYASDKISWKGIAVFNKSSENNFLILKAFNNGVEIGRESILLKPFTKYVNLLSSTFPYLNENEINRVVVSSNNLICGLNISGEAQQRYLFTEATIQTETRNFEEKLFSLPEVEVSKIETLNQYASSYMLKVSQFLDNETKTGDKFIQTVFLNHINESSPVVMYTGGYTISRNFSTELNTILNGNGVAMGHRFFIGAIPNNTDYKYMNIKQAAGDNHRVILLLRDLYKGKWVTTGVSKGGMTTIFHRRFYPDDVDVSVPYVAPILTDLPDVRFENFVNNIAGTESCRNKLREFQRRMLQRRDEIVPLLETYANAYGETYTTLSYNEAYEYMLMEYPVAFWQYGTNECSSIPPAGSSPETLLNHLLTYVGFLYSDNDIEVYKPFYYQAVTQFGYYSFMTESFSDLLDYVPNPSWTTFAPNGISLDYDPEIMQDVLSWIETDGNYMIYIYGGNDPWFSCAVDIGTNTNAKKFVQAGENHIVKIRDLTNKEEVYQTLEQWLGITVNRNAKISKKKTIKKKFQTPIEKSLK